MFSIMSLNLQFEQPLTSLDLHSLKKFKDKYIILILFFSKAFNSQVLLISWLVDSASFIALRILCFYFITYHQKKKIYNIFFVEKQKYLQNCCFSWDQKKRDLKFIWTIHHWPLIFLLQYKQKDREILRNQEPQMQNYKRQRQMALSKTCVETE